MISQRVDAFITLSMLFGGYLFIAWVVVASVKRYRWMRRIRRQTGREILRDELLLIDRAK